MTEYPIRIAQVMGKMENGGVEAVVMNYYRHIDKTKVQFDFIVDSDSSCPQEDEILSMGGKVIRIAPYQNIIANMRDLKKVFIENQYEIVHAELTTMSIFALTVAKKCGIPIRICHGHNTACKGEVKKNIMKYMLRPFSKVFATHFFACSNYAGRWLYGKNIEKSKNYKVIRNAIDTDKFRFNADIRSEVRSEFQIEDKFVIGHIGRFVYQKNHEFLIDIFHEVYKKNKNSVLLLVGEGPLLGEVKKKVHQLGLDKAVKFLGIRQDAYRLYQAFDVFLLPSRYEGLGMVAIESQAAGLPVIVSKEVPHEIDITGLAKHLPLSLPPDKWAEIALSFKCERKDMSKEMRRAGYCIENEVEKLVNFYGVLIKELL